LAGRGSIKEPKSCHERALGLLAVRARSRRELEGRLLGAGFTLDEVDEALSRLERVGLVDDAAFARQLADHRFGVRRAGVRAVMSELRTKGVDIQIIESVIEERRPGEDARALELARARARRLSGIDPSRAFGRLSSALMRRGYAPEVARRAAREALELDAGEF
jgi:regulatory protein